jgi:hypothetical protein
MQRVAVFVIALTAVLAQNPVAPACPFSECIYLWIANYVPSNTATQFSFYYDDVPIQENVNYGHQEVLPIFCNSSAPDQIHQFAIGPSTLGSTTTSYPGGLACSKLFSFFAVRAPNNGQLEVYSIGVREISGVSGSGYMSGLIFNGIFNANNGLNLNGLHCDKDSLTCDVDNRDHRTGKTVTKNTWNEMLMKIGAGQNPVTIQRPNNVVLYDDVVSGSSGEYKAWVFYGDNTDQTGQFPITGGLSSASFITISMTVLVTLSVIVLSMI